MNDDIQILEKKVNNFNKFYNKYKNQNSIDEIELKECLCDILSWTEICIKNIQNLSNIEMEIISAIKYANNMKKHSTSIYKYNLSSLALYPSDDLYPSNTLYPSDFNIWWSSLPLDNTKFNNQYKNYNKHLKEKDIHATINNIYSIIKNHYI
jgi:hypothetical protein